MNKLSLCIIAGNVEQYIERFLRSFAPLADEIVVVQAIGAAAPDRTMEIAAKTGARVAKYQNGRHPEWPHVDDFAAARNFAFSMATHDWVMWADTDDVITPESIQAIKELIEQHGKDTDIFALPYDIAGSGIKHIRERITRKGASQWIQAVHECMAPAPGVKWRVTTCNDASIVHLPHGMPEPAKAGRNMRILESIPEAELTTSLVYHLFTEHITGGNRDKAVEVAAQFFARSDAGETERYEMTLALGATAGDRDEKIKYFGWAVTISPDRREAYLELANVYADSGDARRALAYARAMSALPMPSGSHQPWQLRRRCWGDVGVGVLARAHRCNGDVVLGDVIEINHVAEHGARISLLHATRGRPTAAINCKKLWMQRAADPDSIEHIFAIDSDDDASAKLRTHRHVVSEAGKGCVGAWNLAARASIGQVLVQLSDDWEPPMYWDRIILECIGNVTKPAVLQISDGHRQDNLLCMAILTRARYKQQGYLFHPDFTGVYSDNYFSLRAFADGVVIDARDVVFRHNHPFFGAGQMDATYQRQNSEEAYANGKAIFDRLTQ